MLSDDLIFINAVPAENYFLWQEEVMIVNFLGHGIKNIHILVWYKEDRVEELKEWQKLQDKYPEVSIYFYKDLGVNIGLYMPQLRPHILKQHFKTYPELESKVFFYHDADIIFNYLPDFQSLVEDEICWQSNTSSYLDYTYLKRKEEEGNIPSYAAIGKLAVIGNITISIIEDYDHNTGGAQYILKNIDYKFWEDVEKKSLEIIKAFHYNCDNSFNRIYFPSEKAGFQSWCADMWAVNFALWSRGYTTSTTKELEFSWATDSWKTYLEKPIYHNAGATGDDPTIFYKAAWIHESPIGKLLPIRSDSASKAYALAIENVK